MIYLEKLAQYVKKIPLVWHPKKIGPFGEATKVADESEETKNPADVGGLSLLMARRLSKMVTQKKNELEGADTIEESKRKKILFRPAKFQKYINVLTIISNCLTSRVVCLKLLDEQPETLFRLGARFYQFSKFLTDFQDTHALYDEDTIGRLTPI